jgi:hypothetical protein
VGGVGCGAVVASFEFAFCMVRWLGRRERGARRLTVLRLFLRLTGSVLDHARRRGKRSGTRPTGTRTIVRRRSGRQWSLPHVCPYGAAQRLRIRTSAARQSRDSLCRPSKLDEETAGTTVLFRLGRRNLLRRSRSVHKLAAGHAHTRPRYGGPDRVEKCRSGAAGKGGGGTHNSTPLLPPLLPFPSVPLCPKPLAPKPPRRLNPSHPSSPHARTCL